LSRGWFARRDVVLVDMKQHGLGAVPGFALNEVIAARDAVRGFSSLMAIAWPITW
jgi:hypothetical protein